MEVPKKFTNRTTMWHSSPTSGFSSTGIQNTNLKSNMHFYGRCRIVFNSPDKKVTKGSLTLDKEEVGHVYVTK